MKMWKRIEIASAHNLNHYDGKCARLHGHNYIVEVGITGEPDKHTGMIMDFGDLSHLLHTVVDQLDHQVLNNFIEQPTAENMAVYIADEMSELINKEITVRIYETRDSWVEYTKAR